MAAKMELIRALWAGGCPKAQENRRAQLDWLLWPQSESICVQVKTNAPAQKTISGCRNVPFTVLNNVTDVLLLETGQAKPVWVGDHLESSGGKFD